MNEQRFKSEMRRAQTMAKIETELFRAEYWTGYQRGLRRAYHGAKFGEPGEHEKWLAAANSDDESRKQRGIGYRDGIVFGEIASTIGRPKKYGAVLDALTVEPEIKEALEKCADELGLTLPDIRREAYRKFLE